MKKLWPNFLTEVEILIMKNISERIFYIHDMVDFAKKTHKVLIIINIYNLPNSGLPYKQRAFIIYDNDVTLKNMFKCISFSAFKVTVSG